MTYLTDSGRFRMPHNVRNHLRVEIEQYDAMIRRFIPGYETMIAEAAREVAASSPALVLDIGAGTGALGVVVARRREKEPRGAGGGCG